MPEAEVSNSLSRYKGCIDEDGYPHCYHGWRISRKAYESDLYKKCEKEAYQEYNEYSLVQKFVAAAEKRAEAGTLAKALKKDYVIGLLETRGITVTEEIDAFIEAAVKELDNAIRSAVLEVAGVMEQTAESEEAEAE